MQKYSVNQYLVNNILSWIQSGEIAVPEIQRPFVWKTSQVKDLLDSLYHGYPIGYIIAWRNPNVRLKDGSLSEGKKILIDGQQRITALRAAVLGEEIIDNNYKKRRIITAFHPIIQEFATLTAAIEKDKEWIPDVSKVMQSEGALFDVVNNYCTRNQEVDRAVVEKNITRLVDIKNKQIGFIELDAELDIETVTEIFIRINSKGVELSQADFAMSKIASYDKEDNFGVNLRKCIDYFCHLARTPEFFEQIKKNDEEFARSFYLSKIEWLKNENDDLYDPGYSDVLRVAFTKEFKRGKMSELVSLLSGRNFETREFEQDIVDESFQRLQSGVLEFVRETHFKRFVMIIKSAGFITSRLIRSQNALNMAYILYLTLREKGVDDAMIERYVQRWFVLSILTKRHTGSFETQLDADIKNIDTKGVEVHLKNIEQAELSDSFWKTGLVQELEKSSVTNPFLNVFFASQVKASTKGFLSSDITVANMIQHRGDVHHLFPKEYLKKIYRKPKDYNQIANFVYAQSEINIKVGKKAPKEYFKELLEQCRGGPQKYGNITSKEELEKNLEGHAVSKSIFEMEIEDYTKFLKDRRKLMAEKIEVYYESL